MVRSRAGAKQLITCRYARSSAIRHRLNRTTDETEIAQAFRIRYIGTSPSTLSLHSFQLLMAANSLLGFSDDESNHSAHFSFSFVAPLWPREGMF
jgi:hypothetical protein